MKSVRPVLGLMTALCLCAAPALAGTVPVLDSNPGAAHTLFLDFDGHTDPGGYLQCGVTPSGTPYGLQFAPQIVTSVTATMHQLQVDTRVTKLWEVVADDYAGFDVNVTTVEPAGLAPGGDPTGNAVRVALGVMSSPVALGHAPEGCTSPTYLDPIVDNTAYVSWTSHSNVSPHIIARRISHEAGHLYGLRHHVDAATNGRAPIMSYKEAYNHVWHAGNNRDNGQWQNDLTTLAALLGVRGDDHGETVGGDTLVTPVSGLPSHLPRRVYADGVIEDETDADMFTFRVTEEGRVDVRAHRGAVLDVTQSTVLAGTEGDLVPVVELWNATGTKLIASGPAVVLQANPPGALTPLPIGGGSAPPTLQTGATYRAVVRSQGAYGERGLYTLTVEGPVADLSGPRVAKMEMVCPTSATTERAKIVFDQAITYGAVIRYIAQQPFVRIFDPRGTAVPITSLARVDGRDLTPTEYYVTFPKQTLPGTHRFEVGPDGVQGFGVRPDGTSYDMDQNGDGTGGQKPGDVFEWSRRIHEIQWDEPWYLCGVERKINARPVEAVTGFRFNGF